MPTLSGTLKNASGAGLATSISFLRIGAPGISVATAFSRDIVTATSASDGTFTATLTGGTWRMRWYTALANELTLAMPSVGGPYEFDDVVVDPGDPFPDTHVRWFQDIAEMLATDATEWMQGRTLNAFGTDKIRAGWDRVLLTDAAAAGLTVNTDDVLLTEDGLAYCVRTWLST